MDERSAKMELEAAKAIRLGIEAMVDDEDAVADTLEGETDLDGLIRALLVSEQDDQALIDGCAARVADLKEREARFKLRKERKRTLALQAMEIAGWKKREMDIGTVSVLAGRVSVEITDEHKIPSKYWEPGAPKLNKKDLLADLKEDDAGIPGAELNPGHASLSVRRK